MIDCVVPGAKQNEPLSPIFILNSSCEETVSIHAELSAVSAACGATVSATSAGESRVAVAIAVVDMIIFFLSCQKAQTKCLNLVF